MQDEDDCNLRTACYFGVLENVKRFIDKAHTDSVDFVSEIIVQLFVIQDDNLYTHAFKVTSNQLINVTNGQLVSMLNTYMYVHLYSFRYKIGRTFKTTDSKCTMKLIRDHH